MKTIILPFLALLFLGCQMEQDPVRSIGMGHVKSVTTTFISHQNDTQQKHDQIVSVAEFSPDGSLIRMTNHLSYPYDHADPIDAEFWAIPDGDQLVHVMDGLYVGGEWNFLYGNDWPIKYAGIAEQKGHPRFGGLYDSPFDAFKSTVSAYDQELPLLIDTKATSQQGDQVRSFFTGYEEQFEYQGGKVTAFATKYFYNAELFRHMEKDGKKTEIKTPGSRTDVEYFAYEGDNLSVYTDRDGKEYKYFYENDRLVRAEFHLRGKMRNHRLYYYNEQGLKEKTEIFNTYGEAEYTIDYHYDFYEES